MCLHFYSNSSNSNMIDNNKIIKLMIHKLLRNYIYTNKIEYINISIGSIQCSQHYYIITTILIKQIEV